MSLVPREAGDPWRLSQGLGKLIFKKKHNIFYEEIYYRSPWSIDILTRSSGLCLLKCAQKGGNHAFEPVEDDC